MIYDRTKTSCTFVFSSEDECQDAIDALGSAWAIQRAKKLGLGLANDNPQGHGVSLRQAAAPLQLAPWGDAERQSLAQILRLLVNFAMAQPRSTEPLWAGQFYEAATRLEKLLREF